MPNLKSCRGEPTYLLQLHQEYQGILLEGISGTQPLQLAGKPTSVPSGEETGSEGPANMPQHTARLLPWPNPLHRHPKASSFNRPFAAQKGQGQEKGQAGMAGREDKEETEMRKKSNEGARRGGYQGQPRGKSERKVYRNEDKSPEMR